MTGVDSDGVGELVALAALGLCKAQVGELELNRPVEPGVRDGRNALVRWAVLLEEVPP